MCVLACGGGTLPTQLDPDLLDRRCLCAPLEICERDHRSAATVIYKVPTLTVKRTNSRHGAVRPLIAAIPW
jgi:hypothetical protein